MTPDIGTTETRKPPRLRICLVPKRLGAVRATVVVYDRALMPLARFRRRAAFIREAHGHGNVERVLRRAVKALARHRIPHYVAGGFAVQEHGYLSTTPDVDVIVPDVARARAKLCLHGFRRQRGSTATVVDRALTVPGAFRKRVRVQLNLRPGGERMASAALPFPMPTRVSGTPRLVRLAGLISLKLSTSALRYARRTQDFADAVGVMQANRPSRDLRVDPAVQTLYQATWDALVREQEAGRWH